MTHQVLISLASNHDQEKHLHQARLCLAQILSSCQYTDAIWTKPFSSDKGKVTSEKLYLNQLVSATTLLPSNQLESALKDIERQMGRTTEDRLQGIVRIDLDLLKFDDQCFHLRDWKRPYVKDLLSFIISR